MAMTAQPTIRERARAAYGEVKKAEARKEQEELDKRIAYFNESLNKILQPDLIIFADATEKMIDGVKFVATDIYPDVFWVSIEHPCPDCKMPVIEKASNLATIGRILEVPGKGDHTCNSKEV